MILNESAVKLVGMKRDIVGETIQFNDKKLYSCRRDKRYDHGITLQACTATVFLYDPNWANVITVAIKHGCACKNCLK